MSFQAYIVVPDNINATYIVQDEAHCVSVFLFSS
jgi:hypothetical protein